MMAANIGKNLKLALAGRTISMLGNGIQSIALPLLFLQQTGSLAISGSLFALMQCPAIVLTPWIGKKLENLNKRNCMVMMDFIQAILHLCLLLLLMQNVSLWCLALVLSVSSILSQAFNISTSVLLTELSNEENRKQMNSLKGIVDNGVSLAAPFLGTVIYSALGFEFILIINILSFGLSGIMECFIQLKKKAAAISKKENNYSELLPFFNRKPLIFRLFIIISFLNLLFAPHEEIFYPAILIKAYNYPETVYGLANLLFAAGMMVASFWIYRFGKSLFNLKINLILNSLLMGILGFCSMLGISAIAYFILFMILMLVCGCITSMINIPLISLFQNEVDVNIQSRFFALQSFSSSCLIPLGIFLAGQLSEIYGGGLIMGMFNLCIIILVYLLLRGYNIESK